MSTEVSEINFKRIYTAEEFEDLELPNDGNLYELIEGKIVKKRHPVMNTVGSAKILSAP